MVSLSWLSGRGKAAPRLSDGTKSTCVVFEHLEIRKHRVQHLLQPFTRVWLVFALRAAAECLSRMFKPVVLPAWLMEMLLGESNI